MAAPGLLIHNGLLVTVDRTRRILRRGAILIREGRIAEVGDSALLESLFQDADRLDAEGGIVMPGLVDAHIHLTESVMRGFAVDIPLLPWIRERLRPMEQALDPADILAGVRLSLLEFLRSGITTFVESLFPADAAAIAGAADLILASGLRGTLSIAYGAAADERTIRDAHGDWQGREDRLAIFTALRPLAATTPGVAAAAGRLARQLDTGMSWHFQPYPADPRPLSVVADELRLLWPRALLGHGFGLVAADIAAIAKAGASIVTLPATNTRLAMGSCPVPELLAAGVTVALGSDGDNAHDLFRTMALTGSLHKSRTQDATLLPVETLIEMATLDGARALGLDREIGSIEAGKRADIIILGSRSPALRPLGNPLASIVWGATARDVETVIVQGRILMRSGVQRIWDEERVLADIEERAARLLARAGLTEAARPRWPVEH